MARSISRRLVCCKQRPYDSSAYDYGGLRLLTSDFILKNITTSPISLLDLARGPCLVALHELEITRLVDCRSQDSAYFAWNEIALSISNAAVIYSQVTPCGLRVVHFAFPFAFRIERCHCHCHLDTWTAPTQCGTGTSSWLMTCGLCASATSVFGVGLSILKK